MSYEMNKAQQHNEKALLKSLPPSTPFCTSLLLNVGNQKKKKNKTLFI